MKKILFVLGVVGALAACGGDDTNGTGGGSGSQYQAILDLIPSADATSGQTTYDSLCGTSSCHGSDGNNGATNAGDLPARVPALSDEELVAVIVEGKGAMPPQSQLDDQAVADVVAYCRQAFP